jgi:hypothetical protein
MLYNNICKRPPMTERPAAASLTPKETAAPLLEVEDAPVPVVVPVPSDETLFKLPSQINFPWITPDAEASALNLVQSIDCLLSTLKPPFTLPRAGRFGLDSKLALLE